MEKKVSAPRAATGWETLSRDWAPTMIRALEDMIGHIRAGVAQGDTREGTLVERNNGPIEQDMAFIRHMMGRREVISNEIIKGRGR